MRSVSVEAVVNGQSAGEIYDAIRDFERYPSVSEAVRSVSVQQGESQDEVVSTWEVDFGDGVLQWSEKDSFDGRQGTIRFEQITGDFELFSGLWTVAQTDSTCAVRFAVDFDMGIPSLSAMLEPMAERALRDNVTVILKGLLGDGVEMVS